MHQAAGSTNVVLTQDDALIIWKLLHRALDEGNAPMTLDALIDNMDMTDHVKLQQMEKELLQLVKVPF